MKLVGKEIDKNKKTLAIVGSRAATSYGLAIAEYFAETLSDKYNIMVKLNVGVAAGAIKGCVNAGNPYYVVTATNKLFPASMKQELEDAQGVYIACEEAETLRPKHFVVGSKVLSEVADAVLVVEARELSGVALIAETFEEANKPVFCIPGRITDPLSKACNNLIRDGVGKIVTCPEDVIID